MDVSKNSFVQNKIGSPHDRSFETSVKEDEILIRGFTDLLHLGKLKRP